MSSMEERSLRSGIVCPVCLREVRADFRVRSADVSVGLPKLPITVGLHISHRCERVVGLSTGGRRYECLCGGAVEVLLEALDGRVTCSVEHDCRPA